MTTTQDSTDRIWRRRAEAMLECAQRSLAGAGLSFADDGEITEQAYYLRYEDAGPTTPASPRRRSNPYA